MIHLITKVVTPNDTTIIGSEILGRVLAVSVTSDAAATTAFDMTLTGTSTGIPILTDVTIANNSTIWWYPRALAAVHTSGDASAIAVCEIPLVNESITCVIANTAAGVITVRVIVESVSYGY